MKKVFVHFVLCIIVSVQVGYAQSIVDTLSLPMKVKPTIFGLEEKIPEDMPVVGLALSGGGARGIAQIGVLKAFVDNNIPIDLIVGTSIGSIVGGLFSSGYMVDELDSLVLQAPWENIMEIDAYDDRNELFIEQKITEDKSVFSFRIKNFTPVIPTAINDGQELLNYFSLLTFQAPVRIKTSFNELEIPYRAVCTNLARGGAEVLKSGSLSQAMRASSSVSFFLSPVEIDSLILVDGGLVANIPSRITRNEGADIVIAVNTTSPLRKKEELDVPWVVADQVVSIPMKLVNDQNLIETDFIITPDIGYKKSDDFTDIMTLIRKGYHSALPVIDSIKHSIDSVFTNRLCKDSIAYDNISIPDSGFIGSDYLKKYKQRKKVNKSEILRDIYAIQQEGIYENVKAIVEKEQNNTKISFIGNPKAKIREITLHNVSLIEKGEILKIFSPLYEKPFDTKQVIRKAKKVLAYYKNKGYALAGIDTIHFDDQSGVMEVWFYEGKIGNIIIKGNDKTNPTIITREFPLEKGDYFDIAKVKQGLINLKSTNLFTTVLIDIKRINGASDIILKVKEKISSVLRIGFKVANENTPQLYLDIRDENLFGSATELGLTTLTSPKENSFTLEHKSNRIFETYITYKAKAYYRIRDIYTYKDEKVISDVALRRSRDGEYRQRFYGFSFGIGTQVGRFGNILFEGKREVNDVQSLENNTVGNYKLNLTTLKASTTIDTRNTMPFPTDGIYFHAYYETAQDILGGEIGYSNIGFQYSGHLALDEYSTISARVKLGVADQTFPLSQHYSLGGQQSFFGLREHEFRGRQIFTSALQLQFKAPFKIFFDTYIKLRYDIGNIWEKEEQIKIKNLKHGIGGTLSFDTPIGPADFSFGRMFVFKRSLENKPIAWGPIYFYFSIGYYY